MIMQQLQFIGTTPDTLVELIDSKLEKRLEELKKSYQPKEPKQYLTRQEVSKMLSVDLSTVHNWKVKGILTAYQIGGRVFYLRTDVEKAIVKLNN